MLENNNMQEITTEQVLLDEIKNIDGDDEQEPVKKKRGRKPGIKNKKKETVNNVLEDTDIFNLKQILEVVFNHVLAEKNQNWYIPEEQLTLLATVTEQYVNEKFPAILNSNKTTVNLIAAYSMIVLPRFVMIVKPQNIISGLFTKFKNWIKKRRDNKK